MHTSFTKQYQTSIIFCLLTSAIGWLIIIYAIGSIFITNQALRTEIGEIEFYGIMAISAAGFATVLAGQMAKAILDNTNANLEILHILKKQAASRRNKAEPIMSAL